MSPWRTAWTIARRSVGPLNTPRTLPPWPTPNSSTGRKPTPQRWPLPRLSKPLPLDAAPDASGRIRFVEHFESGGDAVLASACRMHLEGIISKRLDAPYRSGRSETWTKAKCRGGQEVVIAGWTSEAMGKGEHLSYGAMGWFILVSSPLCIGLALWKAPEPPAPAERGHTSARDYLALFANASVRRIVGAGQNSRAIRRASMLSSLAARSRRNAAFSSCTVLS